MRLLDVRNLTLRFGGLTAVDNLDFNMRTGQIMALIGPNGAGKTSVFNAISGVYKPTAGQILLDGKSTARRFSARSVAASVAAAALTALGLVLLLNLESMWEYVIRANYVYQEPFPWRKALSDIPRYIGETESTYTTKAAAAGAAVGLLGFLAIWWRSRYAPYTAACSGIARTFQNPRLFYQMTVIENVMVGMERKLGERFWHAAFRLPKHRRENREAAEKAMDILRFVKLDHAAGAVASSLPYGHQRKLEIARALALEPRLLLLDEPGAGMNPTEVADIMQLIQAIRERGVSVLLIEHHMRLVMGISDYVVVLDFGRKIAEGKPEEVRTDPRVRAAYLGELEA